jgi:iron complex transport system ATP-binding protein
LRAERGLAVIATMHDLNAAALYADRILMLHQGAIASYGSPVEVLDPAKLRAVYGVEVQVGQNPATGTVVVYPAA